MTDRKQSALARRVINTQLTPLQDTVDQITATLINYRFIHLESTKVQDVSSFCDLNIDLNEIRANLSGTFLIDPNLGYEEQPPPTVSPGELGYWTTYTFTCFEITSQNWGIGNIITISNDNGCSFNAKIQSFNKTTGEFVVRIFYPLPDTCANELTPTIPIPGGSQAPPSMAIRWKISKNISKTETRNGCCIPEIDGGWCPIGTNTDLSTLLIDVIDGGTSAERIGVSDISGGYS